MQILATWHTKATFNNKAEIKMETTQQKIKWAKIVPVFWENFSFCSTAGFFFVVTLILVFSSLFKIFYQLRCVVFFGNFALKQITRFGLSIIGFSRDSSCYTAKKYTKFRLILIKIFKDWGSNCVVVWLILQIVLF